MRSLSSYYDNSDVFFSFTFTFQNLSTLLMAYHTLYELSGFRLSPNTPLGSSLVKLWDFNSFCTHMDFAHSCWQLCMLSPRIRSWKLIYSFFVEVGLSAYIASSFFSMLQEFIILRSLKVTSFQLQNNRKKFQHSLFRVYSLSSPLLFPLHPTSWRSNAFPPLHYWREPLAPFLL